MAATTDCIGIETDSELGMNNKHDGGDQYRQVDRP